VNGRADRDDPTPEAPIRPPLPRELQIEVTGACNLSCRMCLVNYRPRLGRAEGAFDLGAFLRLVDELPDLETVTLQGLGEPLLAPGLVEMVRHVAARGARVGFNTNGMLLTRRRAEGLVDAGLDWLHVSLDGATATTHEDIRAGVDFATVVANLRGLTELLAARGACRPTISIVFVAMRRNVSELPAVVRLAEACGVASVWAQGLSHSFEDTGAGFADIRGFTAEEALWEGDSAAEAAFSEARSIADQLGVELRLPRLGVVKAVRSPGEPGCDWPWRSAYVTHRGEVQPCCMVMGSDRVSLGTVASGFPAVWNGDAYAAFRTALTGDEPPAVCRGCSLYRGVF
jgi:radical SAM protein with 4Fe4S-binding SPASM domain